MAWCWRTDLETKARRGEGDRDDWGGGVATNAYEEVMELVMVMSGTHSTSAIDFLLFQRQLLGP